jgi:hypothetical protein
MIINIGKHPPMIIPLPIDLYSLSSFSFFTKKAMTVTRLIVNNKYPHKSKCFVKKHDVMNIDNVAKALIKIEKMKAVISSFVINFLNLKPKIKHIVYFKFLP